MKALIIGGSGFFRNLAEQLVKKGYEINILDIKKPKNLDKNINFFYGDMTKARDLFRATKNCKIIFHLGGISDIKYSIKKSF